MALSQQEVAPLLWGRPRGILRLLFILGGAALVLGSAAAIAAGALGPLWFKLDAFSHLRLQFSLAALAGALTIGLAGAWRGAALASIVGLAGLVSLGPIWRAPAALPARCVAGELTVATANVHDTNTDFHPVVQALLRQDADVVATQESVGPFWSAAAPLRAAYPYRMVTLPEGDRTWRTMLWSKRPIDPLFVTEHQQDAPALAGAVVRVADEEVAVVGLHSIRPVLGPQGEQMRGMARYFQDLPERRVVMGDFNAVPWSLSVALAERSVGAAIVPGFRLTWHGRYPSPLDRRKGWKPPSIIGNQIDHVLTSQQFGVKEIHTFALPGSVHNGVFARLQLSNGEVGCP